MLRKTTLAAAVLAFATAGSALFGGSALAAEDDYDYNTAGPGGAGGYAPNNCFQPADYGSGTLLEIPVTFGGLNLGDADLDASQNYKPVCVSNAPGGDGGDADKADKKDKKDDVRMGH